jgi:hypothetical protein
MMRHGSRTIEVKKDELIARIKENKENHIKEYAKAIVAYKVEAIKQLAEQTQKVKNGSVDAKLDLISPVDNSKNYDDILALFTWDVKDVVELGQDEFKEYVQDETDFAITAKMSNSAYYMGG